jgi:type I restriction enzyme R subunit
LIDEAHRTQYGELASKLELSLPNAMKIGFTGTPIKKDKNNTLSVFGNYIDIYDHKQAIKDGATVKIIVENMYMKGKVEEDIDEELKYEFPNENKKDIEKAKNKVTNLKLFFENKKIIKKKVRHMLNHYIENIKPNNFKAQIATISKKASILYKKELDKQIKEKELNISCEVLISHDKNDNFEKEFKIEKKQEDKIIEDFKDENTTLKFLIVCDKLLTGFDAPIEQVLYLDKILKEHTMFQAIARVNRVYKNKKYGLVVDYGGNLKNIQKAVEQYSNNELDSFIEEKDDKKIILEFENSLTEIKNYFEKNNIDITNKENYLDFFLKNKEKEISNFKNLWKNTNDILDILLPSKEFFKYKLQYKKYYEIYIEITKNIKKDNFELNILTKKIKDFIQEKIYSGISENKGSYEINEKGGTSKIEPIQRALELRNKIKLTIKEKKILEPEYYESLKSRLELILNKFENKIIDADKFLEDIENLENEEENKEREIPNTISEKQKGFYRILKNNITLKDENLEDLTKNLFKEIEKEIVIDWYHKNEIKKKIRLNIKSLISNFKLENKENFLKNILELSKEIFKK